MSKQRILGEALRRLTTGLGVENADLYSKMDENLRSAWVISEADSADIVKCIVICQLERLVNKYTASDAAKEAVALFAFNLPGIPEHARRTNLDDRRQWLAANAGDKSLPRVPIGIGDAILRKLISDFSEDLLSPPGREEVAKMVDQRFNHKISDSLVSPTREAATKSASAAIDRPIRFRSAKPIVISSIAVAVVATVVFAAILLPGKPQRGQVYGLNIAHPSTSPVPKSVSPPPIVTPKGKAPVAIDLIQYKVVENLGLSFAFPRPLELSDSQLATLNSFKGDINGARAWASKLGGVATQNIQIQLVLRGASSGVAIITDLNIKANCGAPLSGTLVSDTPGGGEEKDIGIGFNLDKAFPVASNYDNESFGAPYFSNHTISLRSGETQTVIVHATTSLHYCLFTLQMDVNNKGRSVTWPISNHGKAFAVSASANDHNGMKWSDYAKLYVGGVLSPRDTSFKKIDPKTFNFILPDYGY